MSYFCYCGRTRRSASTQSMCKRTRREASAFGTREQFRKHGRTRRSASTQRIAFNHEIRIRGRGVGGAACLVEAGAINDRGNKPNGHKTKHPIPAIAGTKHPAGPGDHPGRLGDGRNRTRRDVQHPKPKGNPSGTGGHSGPPLHRGFVTEHAVIPSIQNQMKIRQVRADTAVRPYAEDL